MAATELQKGAIGPQVKKLQLLLNSALKPSPHLILDGSFGPGTSDAVKRFQREHKLTVDGVVGPRTWEAFGQRGSSLPQDTELMCRAGAPWLELAALELGVHETRAAASRRSASSNITRRPR